MKRSELKHMPEYFDRYINKCDDAELLEVLQTCLNEVDQFPIDKWTALGDNVYAFGKWTVKDIIQHLIDAERIFCYRALSFARKEPQRMLSFEENDYAANAGAVERDLQDLITELKIVHQSSLALYQSFTPAMLEEMGKAFKGEYSVAAIGFIIAGHQRWHLQILEERYYPLLDAASTA